MESIDSAPLTELRCGAREQDVPMPGQSFQTYGVCKRRTPSVRDRLGGGLKAHILGVCVPNQQQERFLYSNHFQIACVFPENGNPITHESMFYCIVSQ